ncbi:unnamed protein product [Cylicostephanus goldi]|uniref:Uncharacterized protein n=1 Tax=Cylicostephanus goldi TaxID=71465 RepID=A0A3P6TGJ8_CYLGO|nr:unnamed protein product [Cylicostephanus goldi]
MKIVLFALVSGTSAILFGGGGGGGCGSGGFNPPRLGCQRTYFTIPTIAVRKYHISPVYLRAVEDVRRDRLKATLSVLIQSSENSSYRSVIL